MNILKSGAFTAFGVTFAHAVAAGPFDGVYRQSAEADCTAIGVEGGALKIEGGVFTGVDNSCRMERPVSIVDMDAKIYDMVCTGEGSDWQARAIVMRAADGGIVMMWDGYAFKYEACPAAVPDEEDEEAGAKPAFAIEPPEGDAPDG
ncbi:hypothetical protein AAD018_014835 [Aestuariibius insulae]|uniref:hypothetical protein n=1 Tax=Aestuariibius insulae TaxID=2058287 RepID=UPI00345E8CA4